MRKRNNLAFKITAGLLVLLTAFTIFLNYFYLPSDKPIIFPENQQHIAAFERRAILDIKIRIENELRRHRVAKICSYLYGASKAPNWLQFSRERLFAERNYRWWEHLHVNENLGLIYCSIPKIASTNLKQFFVKFQQKNLSDDDDKLADRVHWANFTSRGLRNLAEFQLEDAIKILKNYKKILWVRNPLDRLLSAWKSKLADKFHSYYSDAYGSAIIKMFRKNATEQEINRGYPVELPEFLEFISSQHMYPQYFDVHWRPYLDVCSICAINYDFIGKLEEFNYEFEFLIRNITGFASAHRQIPKKHQVPPQFQTSSRDILKQGRRDGSISKETLARVLAIYKLDYDLFGYNMAADLEM